MAFKKCPQCSRSHSANVLWCPCGHVFGREVEGSLQPVPSQLSATPDQPAAPVGSTPASWLNHPSAQAAPSSTAPQRSSTTPTGDDILAAIRAELARGTPRETIIKSLADRGMDAFKARVLVNRVEAASRPPASAAEASRRPGKEAGPVALMAGGCGLFLLGGIITAISYATSEAGGSYIVFTGLFVVGIVAFGRGLFQLLTKKKK